MSTTDSLLRTLADAYIDAPYKMNYLLSHDQFAQHLSLDGLGASWADLRELERQGLLLPLLRIRRHVQRSPMGLAQGRLPWYRANNLVVYPSLADRGADRQEDDGANADGWVTDSYYHPYQTMWAREVYQASRRPLPPGSEWYWNTADTSGEWSRAWPEGYRSFVAGIIDPKSPHESHRRLLLLVLVDALYLPHIRQGWPRTLQAWHKWRRSIDPGRTIIKCGLNLADITRWRSDVLAHAVIHDPLRNWGTATVNRETGGASDDGPHVAG